MKNLGGGVFTDVTQEAGLSEAVNSNSAAWADYDNDGWLDVFVCCERQANRLYHNKKDGTFEEVAEKVGPVWGMDEHNELRAMWKQTGQEGFWIAGGSLRQNRTFSKYLALQIKARALDLV